MHIGTRAVAALALALVLANNAPAGTEPQARELAARAALDALVTRLADAGGGGDTDRNALVRVDGTRDGFAHAAAAGRARVDGVDRMTADRPFYVASITKSMVAARILQLVEAHRLSLDTTLGQAGLLPADALERLQVFEGRSYGAGITVRQLLSHRTGLRDVLLDDRESLSGEVESGVAPGSIGGIWSSQIGRYLQCRHEPDICNPGEAAALYPAHRWKPFDAAAWQRAPGDRDAGLINFFLAEMGDAGLSAPGTDFHYADTNYILLGMLIEKLTGHSLHAELRDNLFKPLGMDHTYLSYAPDPDARPRDLAPADFWIGDVAVVSNQLDLSFDWAGGGVVATAADLDRFLRGIASGLIFKNDASRAAMLDCIDTPGPPDQRGGYGFGIRCLETEYGPMWGHFGAWGAAMVYFPEYDLSLTGTVDRMSDSAAMQALVFDSMQALETAGVIRRQRH